MNARNVKKLPAPESAVGLSWRPVLSVFPHVVHMWACVSVHPSAPSDWSAARRPSRLKTQVSVSAAGALHNHQVCTQSEIHFLAPNAIVANWHSPLNSALTLCFSYSRQEGLFITYSPRTQGRHCTRERQRLISASVTILPTNLEYYGINTVVSVQIWSKAAHVSMYGRG